MELLGILAFAVALLLSVMVHEFGHYLTAKRFGMKVTEFFLGFGKRIWSFTKGETEFGIKAIPAGGYCRIEGMSPRDEMLPGEEHRAFFTASSGKKLIVLGAGSFAHLLIGFVLIFTIFFGVGVNTLLSDISKVSPNTAAAAAGFAPGDKILKVDGVEVKDWFIDSQVIAKSEGKPLTYLVLRDGVEIEIIAAARYDERPSATSWESSPRSVQNARVSSQQSLNPRKPPARCSVNLLNLSLLFLRRSQISFAKLLVAKNVIPTALLALLAQRAYLVK
jgi:RIP metalloprotease RseP